MGLTADNTGVVITKYVGKAVAVTIPAIIQGMPVREIGYLAFGVFDGIVNPGANMGSPTGRSITSVIIPEGVIAIGNSSFYNCQNLISVTIPSTVVTIGNTAFQNCRALKTIALPEGLTTIGSDIFSRCGALTSITLPEKLTAIGARAFAECKALASITIPDSVQSIRFSADAAGGKYAFKGCGNLTLASQAALKRVGYNGSF